MRPDPLGYLSPEIETLKQQGLFRRLRVLEGEQRAAYACRPPTGRQPLVEQLSRADDPSATARAGARGDPAPRRRVGFGPDHRRHDGHPRGARAPACRIQEDRSRGRLPKRVHRQCRHGLVDPHQRRRRRVRRIESREHHRRLPSEPGDDQGVPAQGRRRRAAGTSFAAGRAAQAAHHRRRVQHGRRPRAAAGAVQRSPRNSAAS